MQGISPCLGTGLHIIFLAHAVFAYLTAWEKGFFSCFDGPSQRLRRAVFEHFKGLFAFISIVEEHHRSFDAAGDDLVMRRIQMTEELSKVLTAEETAEHLRLSSATVYRLAQAGEIPGLRVGRQWRFQGRAAQGVGDGSPSDAGDLLRTGLCLAMAAGDVV